MDVRRIETDLPGVCIIEPDVFGDARGFFTESYHALKYQEHGIEVTFVQDNHSLSARAGTIRGLHYQLPPVAQAKLVRVTQGAIYDVAVDIRRDAETFGRHVGVLLTAENHRQLFVPAGFAHGFCTLVADTHVMYKVDAHYSAEHDRGIRWDDPALGIVWPARDPLLSGKDRMHPLLRDADVF
jgi:dTDP-4-dehydrorhamnose 3,5-epimerase